MRSIYLWSLSLLLLCCSGVSNASTITWWTVGQSGTKYSSWQSAISAEAPQLVSPFVYKISGTAPALETYQIYANPDQNNVYQPSGYAYKGTTDCPFGNTGLQCNASCEAPNVMENGQCVTPVDQCASNSGQPTGWKKTWPSYEAYNSDSGKPKCTTSQNGCAVDICGDVGTSSCAQHASTGEYACFGNGTYTGESQDSSEGGDVEGCEGSACEPPPPQTSTSDKSCTAPAVNGGTTTYTCQSESNADQWSSSNCAVGTVNGVTGLHCTQPDYVPKGDSKVVTDNVTQTTNPDGSTTTTVESTTDRTTCKAGQCTTTSTTTTTTTTSDAQGNTTDETSTCQGDKCDNPATPEDESEEEEEVERTATIGACDASLACEGDPIDCAVLEEQKKLRCHAEEQADFDGKRTDIEALFQGEQFELETSDIQAPSFVNSGTRFLPSSCPPPQSISLTSNGGHTYQLSFEPLCSFASDFSYLIVTMMGIWCAVYVGRAFGGE